MIPLFLKAAIASSLLLAGNAASGSVRSHVVDEKQFRRNLIVGGSDAPLNRYPSFSLIEVNVGEGFLYCGGMLVHKDIVLTAAHCSLDAVSYLVTVNATSFIQGNRNPNEINRVVDKIKKHESFSVTDETNDVMVLRLGKSVDNIPITELNRNRAVPADNAQLTTIGLGLSAEVGGRDPSTLQEVNVNAIPFATCSSPSSYGNDIDDSLVICAGDSVNGGKDACIGDGGGPLLITSGSSDMQVGISSSGFGCGRKDFPGKYTRISAVAEWIDDAICCLSLFPPANCVCSGTPEVPSTGTAPDPPPTLAFCFAADSTVDILGKGTTAMGQVQVGDRILTPSGKYEAMYAWAHYRPNDTTNFVTIHTEDGATLKFTDLHLLYIEGSSFPVAAGAIRVGDLLQPGAQRVTKISSKKQTGFYAPLTYSGMLLVDGIAVSAYPTLWKDFRTHYLPGISVHWASQTFMTPYRLLCGLGTSSLSICQPNQNNESQFIDFVVHRVGVVKYITSDHLLVRLMTMMVIMVLLLASVVVEWIVFHPVLAIVGAVSFLQFTRNLRPSDKVAV